MTDLLDELAAANRRSDEALARLEQARQAASAFDEDASRAAAVERLEARTDIDWTALGATLMHGRAQA